jgi:hypothetical protein
MPVAFIVGPAVALLGIVAVIFVMRHKSVEKHSMYSARRSQIEHKVRAARQRTLAPHGREEKPAPPAGAEAMPPPPPFETTAPAPTFTYEQPAYQAPAYQPPAYEPPAAAAPADAGQPAPESTPWEVGPAPEPPPPPPPASGPSYDYPPTEPEPAYAASPPSTEQAWTPARAQSEPRPAEPVLTTTPAGAGASWSIVGDAKDATSDAKPADKKKKSKKADGGGSWQLASGNAPGAESADDEIKRPSATVAIAQYAVLVVGLVMVLIGVLVMVANSHPS